LYGAFCNLEGGYGSLDGYRKFCEMRRKIRADRIRMKQEQQDDAKEVLGRHVPIRWHFNHSGGWGVVLYMAVDFIFRYAK
jgi:hypothetical protein